MSITPDEAWMEQQWEEFYQEVKEQAIEEVTFDRLQSYYLVHPAVAKPPLWALAEARDLLGDHPSASQVLGAVSIEVGIKDVLLKPIVYGLVHTEAAAKLITEEAMGRQSVNKFKKSLFHILHEHGGIDLNNFKRDGSLKPLWEEVALIRDRRNRIVHRAESATSEEAELAVAVASTVMETLIPSVLDRLGFELDSDGVVRDKRQLQIQKLHLELENYNQRS